MVGEAGAGGGGYFDFVTDLLLIFWNVLIILFVSEINVTH